MLEKEDFVMHTPAPIGYMIKLLDELGFECFLVGGSIRDTIMGLEPKDYDLATNAKIEDLKEIFKEYKVINANGEKHGTVTFRTHGINLEFTTYRDLNGEKNDKLTDCLYRDFTINAIMYSPIYGLYDPYNGYMDIKNKILRSPGSSFDRLEEDPLRILRALRFSLKYGFIISDELKNAIHEKCDGLNRVSVERIKTELDKIIIEDDASDVIYEYKDVFFEIIPELKKLYGFDQHSKYHKNDCFLHSLNVLKNASKDPNLKMAALLHDIGKPECFTMSLNSDNEMVGHFYGHPKYSFDITMKILERLRYSNKEIKEISYYVINHEMADEVSKKAIRRLLKEAPFNDPKIVRNLFNLKLSDSMDHLIGKFDIDNANHLLDQVLENIECLSVNDIKLTGLELNELGFYKKDIGKMKRALLELVLNEEVKNTKEDLIKAIETGKAKILKGNENQ